MTVLLGSGGSNIATPFPQGVAAIQCNYPLASATLVAPLPANDGSSLVIKTNTVDVYSKANVLLYSCAPTAINASATTLVGVFLDTVNSLIWIIVTGATAGAGYLGTMNYTTGSISAIGTGFTGATNTLSAGTSGYLVNAKIERATVGSGNLTVWNGTYNFSLSTTTGAVVVAENQLLLNSVGLAAATSTWSYSTLDKTLFMGFGSGGSSGTSVQNICLMTLFRNGRQVSCSFDASGVGGFGSNINVFATMPWGASNVWLNGGLGIAMYVRTSFDQWLQNIATSLGMP
jgi:hypothetical protein